MQAAQSLSLPKLERITVTTAAGKTYNLGRPDSPLFRTRVWLYKKKRGIR